MNATTHRFVLTIAWLAGAVLTTGSARVQAAQPDGRGVAAASSASPLATEEQREKLRYVGAGSCAAVACHGGPAEAPAGGGIINVSRIAPNRQARPARVPRRSEYNIWFQRDPHAGALEVLRTKRSQDMAARLGLGSAHTAEICLNCHAVNLTHPDGHSADAHGRFEDVSCEACHGPAGGSWDFDKRRESRAHSDRGGADYAAGWLEPHKRRDWAWKTVEEKAKYGFYDTQDAVALSTRCAKCHVGSPGRDVNHDLIAAGHPRLYFEMSAFIEKLPHHWARPSEADKKSKNKRDVEEEPRLWAVGQFTAAKAAVDLLHHRASLTTDPVTQKGSPPWPELAENACFACHHDLAAPSWRQQRQEDARFAGVDQKSGRAMFDTPRWGSWYFALTEDLAKEFKEAAHAEAMVQARAKLTAEMAQPVPNRDVVVSAAADLSRMLEMLAQSANRRGDFAAEEVLGMRRLLLSDSDAKLGQPWKTPADWEVATQVYLGMAAIVDAEAQLAWKHPPIGDPQNPQVLGDLQGIRDDLRFRKPDGGLVFQSPIDFDAPRIDALSTRLNSLRSNWKP